MQFLRNIWPIQLAFPPCIFVGYSSPPWLSVILNFSHQQIKLLSRNS
jgi:hypothetical protein